MTHFANHDLVKFSDTRECSWSLCSCWQRRYNPCERVTKGFFRANQSSIYCVQAEGLLRPLREVEMPLVPVLAHMEAVGVAVDPTIFAKHKVPSPPKCCFLAVADT